MFPLARVVLAREQFVGFTKKILLPVVHHVEKEQLFCYSLDFVNHLCEFIF